MWSTLFSSSIFTVLYSVHCAKMFTSVLQCGLVIFSGQVLVAVGGGGGRGKWVVEVVCFRAKSWVLRTAIKRPLKCKANFIARLFLLNENGVVQWGGGRRIWAFIPGGDVKGRVML